MKIDGKDTKLKFVKASADFGEPENTPLDAFARDQDATKDKRVTGPIAYAIDGDDKTAWGIDALHRVIHGLTCKTAVHICYGYGIQANLDWKKTLGDDWNQYKEIFPALAASRIDQVSLECANSHVPMELIALLRGKDVLVGVIDVASDKVETPEEVAATIERALAFVPKDKLFPCTNCGMAPMSREIALAKLRSLGLGAALARQKHGG